MPSGPLPLSVPRCAVHPEEAAGGTCPRCGSFFCPACAAPVVGVVHCAACAARPEVNYLEALRQKLWGRRDAWTWCVGFGSAVLALGALRALSLGDIALGLALLLWAAVGVAFFLGVPRAREAFLAAPLVMALGCVPVLGAWALPPLLFAFGHALALYADTRNQLFFRRDVSAERLRKLWDYHVNNPLARHALSLGSLSFLVPLAAPAALLCGGLALKRVNLQATPPIGRRGQALAGILLAVAAVALWLTVLGPLVLDALAFLGEN
ncbi:hypothetical protein P2318_00025 [Myxococcaceae bacterium GXIMD 01537]